MQFIGIVYIFAFEKERENDDDDDITVRSFGSKILTNKLTEI